MASVNLIPREMLNQRTHKWRMRFWGITVAVSFVLALIPVGRELLARYQLSSQRESLTVVSESLAKSRLERDQSREDFHLLKKEIARSERLRFKRDWTSLIAKISAQVPESVWLISLSTDPARPSVKRQALSPTLAMSQPRLVGKATPEENSDEDYSGLIGKGGPYRIVLEGHALGIEGIFVFVDAVNSMNLFSSAILKSVAEGEVEGLPINKFKMECEW